MYKLGFQNSEYDTCLYFKSVDEQERIFLWLYVDDVLIACKNMLEIQKLKKALSGEFEMKDLGLAKRILGMEILRLREHMKLVMHQKNYLLKVLERFGMTNLKGVLSPLTAQLKLYTTGEISIEEMDFMKDMPYSNIVGSSMHVMVYTRLDVSYVISMVSSFMPELRREHWHTLK